MKGDFSRDSFDPLHRYSRVLMQMGRVELDADVNEREAIQLHLQRTLAADLIGPAGGPGSGFEIKADKNTYSVEPGRYYVDGWMCENDALHLGDAAQLKKEGVYLVYLDVWERHVAAAEADGAAQRRSPTALREVALGGPDTASRAQLVWRVRAAWVDTVGAAPKWPTKAGEWGAWMAKPWVEWLVKWQAPNRGLLMAKATDPAAAEPESACVVAPQSRYRGLENQLYRVEIHRGGKAGEATFVWSRENGSVLYAIAAIAGPTVTLAEIWRDARFALSVGDCVEISDDTVALNGSAGSLHTVKAIDLDTLTVTLDSTPPINTDKPDTHPVVRRWDHGGRKSGKDGSAELAEDGALQLQENGWLTIEDGLAVSFQREKKDEPTYRSGDYWLLPARVALGDVLWPLDPTGAPRAVPPHGVEHHYAPLAVMDVAKDGAVKVRQDVLLRRQFKQLVDL